MNFIDIAILLIFAITILGGYYRGFINTMLSIGATIVSYLFGMLCVPFISAAVQSKADLFNMLLYYTEGSEYVAVTNVELTRAPISEISAEQLRSVIQNADMPLPLGRCVTRNIATEAFAKSGITTLGDYFNQTIVCVAINILALLVAFLIIRLILGFVIHCVDYARGGFPVLQKADGLIGAGLGLINGVLLLFIIFLAVPLALTVLPKVYTFLEESFFGEFFYKANILIPLIPGT